MLEFENHQLPPIFLSNLIILDTMNPFFQWNSQSRNPGDWPNSSQGPTYGALPNLQSLPYSMTFNFIMSNSSILNCSVTGTNSLTYLYVSTNATSTTLTRRNGEVCGTITWGQHAIVEARGKIERQRTSEWLRLTGDRRLVPHYLSEIRPATDEMILDIYSRRTMQIGGRTYSWIPRENSICVCAPTMP